MIHGSGQITRIGFAEFFGFGPP